MEYLQNCKDFLYGGGVCVCTELVVCTGILYGGGEGFCMDFSVMWGFAGFFDPIRSASAVHCVNLEAKKGGNKAKQQQQHP
jgi:hypothetical protein